MKKLFQSIFFKLFAFSVLIVFTITLYFYAFQYLPSQEKLIRSGLLDRAKTVFGLSGNTLTKGIQTHDDIMMLTTIESIMKIEDINTAYVLDNDRKVMLHDKTSEWGTVYNDETATKAVGAGKTIRQRVSGGYIFSTPLTSSATLCVGISTQKLEESIASLNKDSFYSALIVLITGSICFFVLVYYMAFPLLKSLRAGLGSLELGGSGRLPDSAANDEFGELQRLINSVLDKSVHSGLPADTSKKTGIYDALTNIYGGGVIIFDGENKVLSLNTEAEKFIASTGAEVKGKHILDIPGLASLLVLIKKASEKPGEIIEMQLSGRNTKALASRDNTGIIVLL